MLYTKMAAALLLLTAALVVDAANRPAYQNKVCPRKAHLTGDRRCKKACKTDTDCRGRKKQCVCDDVCGLSCLNPRGKCPPQTLANGRVKLDGRNQLGAVARYICMRGYKLQGVNTRLCTGDREWSGVAPRCLPVDSNPAVRDGPQKIEAGTDRSVSCSEPPSVLFADHDGLKQTRFVHGSEVRYTCRHGFVNDGLDRAVCMITGEWAGPMMTCRENSCAALGDIANGVVYGRDSTIGSKVNYECKKGYRLVGQPTLICQHDLKWNGRKPTCEKTSTNSCERLRAPKNGFKIGRSYSIGSLVTTACDPGYKLKGTSKRMCRDDGTWSGEEPSCEPINCGHPGVLYNGYIQGSRYTLGSIIRYRCMSGTKFEGIAISATCLETGQWSLPIPKCLRSCQTPSIEKAMLFVGAVEAAMSVEHGTTLEVVCPRGLAPSLSAKPTCNNGTWSRLPTCVQGGCNQRPKEISNGIALYRGTRFGDRVRYTCNTGHKLIGDKYMTCQGGEWKGRVPECKPVFCPHPGDLENGKILLVGNIGKFEYRPFIRQAGQGEKIEYYCSQAYRLFTHGQAIEYFCHDNYRLDGPSAATCIDGFWSPDRRPRCIDNQHPMLPDSQEIFTT